MKKLVFFISAFFVLYTNTDAFGRYDTRSEVKEEQRSLSPYNKFVQLWGVTRYDQSTGNFSESGICTAQYIAPNLILSAGHCVYDDIGRIRNNAIGYALHDNNGNFITFLDFLDAKYEISYDESGHEKREKDWAVFLIKEPEYYSDDYFEIEEPTSDVSVINAGWGAARIFSKQEIEEMQKAFNDSQNNSTECRNTCYENNNKKLTQEYSQCIVGCRQVTDSGSFMEWVNRYLANKGLPSLIEQGDYTFKVSKDCSVQFKNTNNEAIYKNYNIEYPEFLLTTCFTWGGNSGGAFVSENGKTLYAICSAGKEMFLTKDDANFVASAKQFKEIVQQFKMQYPAQTIDRKVAEEETAKEREAAEKAAAEKRVAEEKAAKEREAAEKRAAEEKAAKEREAAEKRAAEEKAAKEREAAEKAAAEKKAAEEKAAKEREAAEAAAAEKRAAEEKAAKEREAAEAAAEKRAAEEKTKENVEHMPVTKGVTAPGSNIPDDNDTERIAALIKGKEEEKAEYDKAISTRLKDPNMSTDAFARLLDMTAEYQYTAEEIEKLQKAYDDAKAKEQSLANRALTAATVAATGLGGMELARGLAEQAADKAAEKDMAAYIATFRCEYANGKSVKAGPDEIELPGGNNQNLMNLRGQYFALASDLKERKEALGMKPGIESEEILDKATLGLYDDENVGITGGAEASLYRAQMLGSEKDKSQLDEMSAASAKRVKGGAIAAGAGVVGGVLGDSLINGELGQKLKDAFKSKKVGKETESLLKKDTAALDDLKKCLQTAGIQETDKLEFKKFYASVLSVKGIDCKNAFAGQMPNGKKYSDIKASDLFADSTDATAVFNSLANSFSLANVGKMIGYASLNENNKNLGIQHLNKSMENIKKQYETAEKKDSESASKLGINLGSVLGNSMGLRDLMSNKDLMSQIGSMVKK